MHFYKKHIGDYYKKAGRLTMLQHGAYTLLIDACYDREKFPTLDDALDWCWASNEKEVAAVRFVLDKFFVLNGLIYEQSRIKEELQEYIGTCLTNSINGKKGGRPKANKTQSVNLENDSVNLESEKKRTVSESKPNHEPLTTNHEPLTKDQNNVRKKTTQKKAPKLIFPEWLDKGSWSEFEQHRKETKKPLTDLARKKNLLILEKHKDRQSEIINTTIANRWQGLFEPKENKIIVANQDKKISLGERATEVRKQYESEQRHNLKII